MPYRSDAQRKFFHTDTAKAAGITGDEVKEFDKASKGKKLPEHVKMSDGGFSSLLGRLKDDKNEAAQADAVDPAVLNSSDTIKTDSPAPVNQADGGVTPSDNTSGMPDEPGLQDTSIDFLAPFLLGPAAKGMAEGLPAALDGLGESGEITIGRAAPKMEEAAEAVAPKVEPFVKGIQKSPNGNEVKLWGVRGDPSEIAKLGYGSDPATVPESVLREKGILPPQVDVPGQPSPNGYCDGGPAGMAEGGYPHVTFMENQTPAGVKETTHLAKSRQEPAKMAGGGTIHKAEGRDKEPAKPKDIEMSHENKLNSIYKAMGIKKYADGGEVDDAPNDVDPSQLPGGNAGPPSPTDPGYWDQIKAALSQVGSTMGSTLPTMPGVASGAADVASSPGIAPAINTALGTNIPEPTPAVLPTAPPMAMPTPATAPENMPPAFVPPPTRIAPTAPPAGMPNLGNIFNQDTSALTSGVNPEDRQALANKLQSQQHGLGAIIAQAVAGLGDALAAKGHVEQHSLQNIFNMQTQQRQEAMANFDAARQDRVQKLQLQTQMGNNALNQTAAADAYGVDDNLNKLVGAPTGTMKKDLPTYFSLMSAQVQAKEKDQDLHMKALGQASTDVDNAIKNSSILGIKPSPAQLQASGLKLADQYYNKAKGNVLIKPSDDGQAQWIPAQRINDARKMDPNLQIIP